MKQVEYGKWYPCRKGTMPEDILGYSPNLNFEFTPIVIIPCLWGNQYGCGQHTSVPRARERGKEKWEWFGYPSAKPLVWMAIPPSPSKEEIEKTVEEYVKYNF